jgi:hypothetical protein
MLKHWFLQKLANNAEDRWRGISTGGIAQTDKVGAVHYATESYADARWVLRALDLQPSDTFIDVGAEYSALRRAIRCGRWSGSSTHLNSSELRSKISAACEASRRPWKSAHKRPKISITLPLRCFTSLIRLRRMFLILFFVSWDVTEQEGRFAWPLSLNRRSTEPCPLSTSGSNALTAGSTVRDIQLRCTARHGGWRSGVDRQANALWACLSARALDSGAGLRLWCGRCAALLALHYNFCWTFGPARTLSCEKLGQRRRSV